VPWRGPRRKGEYPSLGYEVGDWIEDNLIVPDGRVRGGPICLPMRCGAISSRPTA